MGAAEVGVVEDDDVAGLEAFGEGMEGGLYGGGHCAEVYGLVGGLGDHFGGGVEEGAGEVLALFHIGGVAGALEGDAHLLGYGDEHIFEYFQADGVDGHSGGGSWGDTARGAFGFGVCIVPSGAGWGQAGGWRREGSPAKPPEKKRCR